jgi:hypothetical protein
MANISRSRGDTYPVALDLKDEDSGQPYAIPSGSTFLLTVSEISLPDDASEQVFQSAGEVFNASLGMVRFPISAEAADILGTFYHDIQMTSQAGLIRTVDRGQYVVKQDITKDGKHTILLDDFGPDDTDIIATGINGRWVTDFFETIIDPASGLFAKTRDSRRTVRWFHPEGFATPAPVAYLRLSGDSAPYRFVDPYHFNVELEVLAYVDDAVVGIRFDVGGAASGWVDGGFVNDVSTGGRVFVAARIQPPTKDAAVMIDDTGSNHAADGPGWYRMKMFIEKRWASVRGKYWADGDTEPEAWEVSITPDRISSQPMVYGIHSYGHNTPLSATSVGEIASLSYRVWS